jgi:futalosine hydrolase
MQSDRIDLGSGPHLLSVASAAGSAAEVAARRARHPEAAGEEMEGFAVAIAARLHGVGLTIVRGFSNVAGDRDRAGWRIEDALRRAAAVVMEAVG